MNKKMLYTLGTALVLLSAGCSSDDKGFKGELIEITSSKTFELSDDELAAGKSLSDASVRLMNEVAKNYESCIDPENRKSENFIMSPLSICLGTSMVANSIEGADQAICDLYGVKSVDQINSLCNKAIRYLSQDMDGTVLKIGNSIWYQQSHSLDPVYSDIMRDMYFAECNAVDFNSHKTADIINSWVAAKTRNMIDHVINGFDPQTLAVVINALYFQGRWYSVFDPDDTDRQIFRGSKGDNTVDMMHKVYNGRYASDDDFESIIFNFKNYCYMQIIMPKKMSAIEASKTITHERVRKLYYGSQFYDITLSLPSFRQDATVDLNGIIDIPTGGMLSPMGIDRIAESIVMQNRSVIDINEEGGKLASTTFIGLLGADIDEKEPMKVTFTVDRPFLFFITDYKTGLTLMSGRICNL
ncbi:MAG: serpin family protein [Bacteroidales bacterium]|nr:serpin family protein [Bacteroidales bacterium]